MSIIRLHLDGYVLAVTIRSLAPALTKCGDTTRVRFTELATCF